MVFFLFIAGYLSPGVSGNLDLLMGLEFSELYQNRFNNLGISNFTIFLEGNSPLKINCCRRLRFLAINVDLSNEHLSDGHLIQGDTDGLTGHLSILRVYSVYSTAKWKNGFLNLSAKSGLGAGYVSTSLFKDTASANETGIMVSAILFIQWELWKRIAVEFPVMDFSVFLYKRGSLNQGIDGITITTPPYFQVYLWINIGILF